jgi:hypothetical protein
MTTTTTCINDDLKARALPPPRPEKTAHAFILDAIAGTVEQVEGAAPDRRGQPRPRLPGDVMHRGCSRLQPPASG